MANQVQFDRTSFYLGSATILSMILRKVISAGSAGISVNELLNLKEQQEASLAENGITEAQYNTFVPDSLPCN